MKYLAKALMLLGTLCVAAACALLLLTDADSWAEFWKDVRGEGLINWHG